MVLRVIAKWAIIICLVLIHYLVITTWSLYRAHMTICGLSIQTDSSKAISGDRFQAPVGLSDCAYKMASSNPNHKRWVNTVRVVGRQGRKSCFFPLAVSGEYVLFCSVYTFHLCGHIPSTAWQNNLLNHRDF